MLTAASRQLATACQSASHVVRITPRAVRGFETATGSASRSTGRAVTTPTASGRQQGGSGCTHRPGQVAAASVEAQPMEVEVKLRLSGPDAHKKLQELLAPSRVATHQQENYFFDGPNRELNSKRVVLRLRFYDADKKAEITLKGKQIVEDGIGRASEVNEPIDAVAARQYLEHPSDMLALPSELIQNLAKQYNLSSLVCLGGFNNTRQEIHWHGFTLELDETSYPWGTVYELEAETDKPEALRKQLEEFLQAEGIDYSYSTTSKFANFINKTLV